ncbi:MAG: IS1634 family transposase [Gammaproteobacteria bacterium]|nr:IS1634 family transposase [Gammaproteobacteria bacterium]
MQLVRTRELSTEVIDHHGLVAAVSRDLGIAEKINRRIGSKDPRRKIQPGLATVAMIINGLGFTNRRLYLTPQFFQSKAMESLFEENVCAKDFDDHALGKALDEIADYGSSKLFGEMAFEIAMEQGVLGPKAHLDSTSFVLHGEYADNSSEEMIEVTHGYSKDHRPDLKQVMMSLTMSGAANLPIWMEPLNGNSSDKTSFHETIGRVCAFQKQLKTADDFFWVADSALYVPDKLLACSDINWLSRVPENIKACANLVSVPSEDVQWTNGENGYKWTEVCSKHGDIKQRWLLVFSQQAYDRESKTLMRRIAKEEAECLKASRNLDKQVFGCLHDAEKHVIQLNKKYRYHVLQTIIEPIEKYECRGRPNPLTPKVLAGYRVICTVQKNEEQITSVFNKKGRFILATNQLNQEELPAEKILTQYKEQQSVEGGFRFLKDPWFMVDSFFVKTKRRIEALMMIMTLCLLVYNFAQYRVRKNLKDQNENLPNQLGKPINNPTVKWLFQCMEGISIIKTGTQAMIANLDDLKCKIITLFGATACQIYGIDREIAGM